MTKLIVELSDDRPEFARVQLNTRKRSQRIDENGNCGFQPGSGLQWNSSLEERSKMLLANTHQFETSVISINAHFTHHFDTRPSLCFQHAPLIISHQVFSLCFFHKKTIVIASSELGERAKGVAFPAASKFFGTPTIVVGRREALIYD